MDHNIPILPVVEAPELSRGQPQPHWGWNPDKVREFSAAYYDFLNVVKVNSKEKGPIILGEHVYRGQRMFFDGIFDGLSHDIHDFKTLKSRQLGVSTGSRALTLFWIGMHDGLKGYMIFDTTAHMEEARLELIDMLNSIPKSYKFPRLSRENRYLIRLTNGSSMIFASAGVRNSKSSGTLGRSSGISFVHASEMCSWDNIEGLEAFKNSLAEDNPNRLYIWESTARGFNQWEEMWREARADSTHQKCTFLGWWSKDNQIIAKNNPDYEKYGMLDLSTNERKKTEEVKKLYNWDITQEQWAWYRRKMDPGAKQEGDARPDFEGDGLKLQEQPSTEQEAFQVTGSTFFEAERLTEIEVKTVSKKFKTYHYGTGIEFTDCRIYPSPNARMVELKVWNEPEEDNATYVIAADPAFGANEHNDRSAIQVLRCYADGCDQVAEYAWPLVNSRQFGWVIMSLCGYYGGDRQQNEIYLILELNGPGEAVWNEIQSLKSQLAYGYQPKQVEERGLRNIYQNVRNYIYNRSDSMSSGRNFHWYCLALDTPLPTPDGWTTMGEVKIGDELLDETGRPCRVLNTSPVRRNHLCYRLTFDDKSSIVADANHLWKTASGDIVKTKDLVAKKDKICCSAPLVLDEDNLPLDPYVLGVWLGDGSMDGGLYWIHKDDRDDMRKNLESCGMTLGLSVRENNSAAFRERIVGLTTMLRPLGVLGNKHIPGMYLRASFSQRLSLLQGLMDTDGNVTNKNGVQCGFTTTLPALRDGFEELLRSLGIKAKHCVRHRTVMLNGRMTKSAATYQFWFTAYPDVPPFRLPRKIKGTDRHGAGFKFKASRQHKIINIEQVKSVPVKCVEVDSSSHLFLAGRGMVPTHNTKGRLKVTIMERLRDFVSNGLLVLRSHDTIQEMKSITRQGDSIAAQGNKKDDRVLALAFGIRCWEERVRKGLMALRRTRESEAARRRLNVKDQLASFNTNMLESFFSVKRAVKARENRQMSRAAWRGRR